MVTREDVAAGSFGPGIRLEAQLNDIRSAFLEASGVALTLMRDDRIREAWDEPSALPLMSVGALAGHLKRATGSVEAYLDRPEPEAEPVSPAEYYAAALSDPEQTGGGPNLESKLHVAIRQRGQDEAAPGYDGVLQAWEDAGVRLKQRLESEPEDRRVDVFKGICLLLDDYLITRMIEIVVHTDDLAVSVGAETPTMPPLAMDLATEALVDTARVRHGDVAVMRALTRRERDSLEALRVL